MRKREVSERRKRNQGGSELIEFGLLMLLMMPLFLGMFVTGFNLVRANQATMVTRDLGDLYIHGTDFSTSSAQNLAVRLANGLGLQPNFSGAGNNATGITTGNGLVVLSQVTYIGGASCVAAGFSATGCPNYGHFVFTQRVVIGNKNLQFNGAAVQSTLGVVSGGASVTAAGGVNNYSTDPNARLDSSHEASFSALWSPTLSDGQFVYAAEAWFASQDLSISALSGQGVYARFFF
jgi:hypothetical protein